jgi:uncharacterized protein (TIGR01777 family)
MATILITGGTGMIGGALTHMLTLKGHKVIIATRKPAKPREDGTLQVKWDVKKGLFPTEVLKQTDYIVHLAGANVADKRWTSKRKAVILSSRKDSAALIVQTLRDHQHTVKAVISASAIGWYGPDEASGPNASGSRHANAGSKSNAAGSQAGEGFRESAPAADDFLGVTCKAWEEAIAPVKDLPVRLVIIRTGIALDKSKGAFPAFRAPVRAGLATIFGDGKQVMSWIHLVDLCRIYLQSIENEGMEGVYNAVAPGPVTQKAFMVNLASRLKGRFYIPVHVPAFFLKLLLGEMSVEVLKSCTVDCHKLRNTGFQFVYPTIDSALGEITGTPSESI